MEGQAVQQPVDEHQLALSVVDQVFGKQEPEKEVPKETAKEATPSEPAQEAQPEETVQEEQPAQEEVSTEEPQETPKETRRFKLKYKGEEIEKAEDEVITLAQQGFDYTQKSQAVAKERAEIQEKIKSSVEPTVKEYKTKLQVFEKALWQALAPEVNSTDWNALARDDPAQWAQRMQQVTNVNNVLRAVQQELSQMTQKQQQELQQASTSKVREAREALERDLPGWNDDLYQKILRSGVDDYGFQAEEVGAWVDPRAIKVLHDAMKYRTLQKTKPQVDKRVESVPKVIKPGTSERANPQAERYQKAMADLKKTGRTDEAMRVARLLVG